jgi:hypothetical protein
MEQSLTKILRMKQFMFLLPRFVVCSVFILSCNNAGNQKFEFYYYPARNIYYDVAMKEYLYSLDGGTTWDSINIKTNADVTSTLGTKRIIYSTTPEIWRDNSAHIQQYNGHAINIMTNDTTVSGEDLAADRKLKKPKTTGTNAVKPSEKKPGFFKRLFGQKN